MKCQHFIVAVAFCIFPLLSAQESQNQQNKDKRQAQGREDDLADSREREILNKLEDTETLLKRVYHLSDQDWLDVRIQFDEDYDGELNDVEGYKAAEFLELRRRENEHRKGTETRSIWQLYKNYILLGAAVLLVFLLYKARQNSSGASIGGGYRLGGDEPVAYQPPKVSSTLIHTGNVVRRRNLHDSESCKSADAPHERPALLTKNKVSEQPFSATDSSTCTHSNLDHADNSEVEEVAVHEEKSHLTEKIQVKSRRSLKQPAILPQGVQESTDKSRDAKKKGVKETPETCDRSKPNVQINQKFQVFQDGCIQDQLVAVTAQIFDVEVVLQVSGHEQKVMSSGSFNVKPSDLPATENEALKKAMVLFERRAAREFLRKIRFCIQCYDRCGELQPHVQDSVVSEFLTSIIVLALQGIMEQLRSEVIGAVTVDEDDFWSDIAAVSGDKPSESEAVVFVSRISGYVEDGVGVSSSLLTDIMKQASSSQEHQQLMVNLIKATTAELKKVLRYDELVMSHGRLLRGLEILLQQPEMTDILAARLEKEIDEAATALGVYFETHSVLGNLLTISTIPASFLEGSEVRSPKSEPWAHLRGFPKSVSREDLSRLEGQIQEGLKRIKNIVYLMLRRLLKQHQQTTLAWLATLVSMNEIRLMQASVDFRKSNVEGACSHGFMLNMCAVLLELCMPFCSKSLQKLLKADVTYASSPACRLNYDFETCLAGGQIVSNEENKNMSTGRLPTSLQGKFDLVTEMFNITQRAMHVGFHPAYRHLSKMLSDLSRQLASLKDTPQGEDLKQRHLLIMLKWDCSIIEEDFLRYGTAFYLAQAHWIMTLLKQQQQEGRTETEVEKQQKRIFSQLPEFIIKDMARWFNFMASHGLLIHPTAFSGHALDPAVFVECSVILLERPDLMPGPILATRLTEALLSFLRSGRSDKNSRVSFPTEGKLTAMVHLCPSVQNQLGPALLRTFVSVDVVEGLDVDKDDFDKYGARGVIGRLIQELWERHDCRSSMLALAGKDIFQTFLGSTLDTLSHQLHDSLDRIANVKKVQTTMENKAAWEALPMTERITKKQFLAGEEAAAEGFMRSAKNTLELISMLVQSPEVATSFARPPLAQKSATAFLGFLDYLCGPKASDLKVKDMTKYSFNPKQLLTSIVEILLKIAAEDTQQEDGFLCCVAGDDDLNMATMERTASILQYRGLAAETTVSQFEQFVAEVTIKNNMVSQRQANMEVVTVHDWQSELDQRQLDVQEIEQRYISCLGPCRYETAEIEDSHSFQTNAENHGQPGRKVIQTLHKEMKSWTTDLPVHPNASVFIVQDENRMDMVRVMVTGPADTPYSRGCFAFDVYFPPQYPNIPPVFKFITTGNGKRFNPNLYADGKVCLSLLNTWHSTDESQKWNPSRSTLYQILLSLQSLILVSDPLFNEPGYESIKSTAEGKEQSAKYNAKIQLLTVRVAMLGQLRNPPAGLKAIIRQHFRIQRDLVLQQCSQWLHSCLDKTQEKLLRRAVDELRVELAKLGEEEDEEEENEKGATEDAEAAEEQDDCDDNYE